MSTSTLHLGIFYMPQICDMGPTALLPLRRKACWGFFRSLKIRRFRPGLNPRTWVLKASTLPLDQRSRLPMKILQRNLNRSTFVVWEMKRNVCVVCVCSARNCCDTEQRSASQPGSVASGTRCICALSWYSPQSPFRYLESLEKKSYVNTFKNIQLIPRINKVFYVTTYQNTDRASWIDYTLITKLMHWLLFIHKILFSSTCFEHQVLIFRRT